VHLLAGPELDAVTSACHEAGKDVVGIEARPNVIVTADGMQQDGVVRPLKLEVDEAVPDARMVIVLRVVGETPLAPTLDAYLETEMFEGRDVWLHDLVRSD
jgi:hypothetical protein